MSCNGRGQEKLLRFQPFWQKFSINLTAVVVEGNDEVLNFYSVYRKSIYYSST